MVDEFVWLKTDKLNENVQGHTVVIADPVVVLPNGQGHAVALDEVREAQKVNPDPDHIQEVAKLIGSIPANQDPNPDLVRDLSHVKNQ